MVSELYWDVLFRAEFFGTVRYSNKQVHSFTEALYLFGSEEVLVPVS